MNKPTITRHSFLNSEGSKSLTSLTKTRSASNLEENIESSSKRSKTFSKHTSFDQLVHVSNMELQKLRESEVPHIPRRNFQEVTHPSSFRQFVLSKKLVVPMTIKDQNMQKITICLNPPANGFNSTNNDNLSTSLKTPTNGNVNIKAVQNRYQRTLASPILVGPPNCDYKTPMAIASPKRDTNFNFFQPTPDDGFETSNIQTSKISKINVNVARQLQLADSV